MALADILTVSLLMPGVLGAPDMGPARVGPWHGPSPTVAVWTNKGDDVFERGDRMTVYLRTDVDAYVTLFRVNTDGQVRILFPARPRDDNFVRGGARVAVRGTRESYTLRVQEYPGEGFLFAVVTLDPIAYSAFTRAGQWDYGTLGLARRITTDPYVLFTDLLAALVPETYPYYGYAVRPYYVDERHDYPRFLCYQCHAYVSPAIWDPYAHSCIRIGVPEPVWWQYPTHAYGGTAVVPPPRRLPTGYVIPSKAPVARPGVPPRDRTSPALGTPAGRRPAPAPVATVPPPRRVKDAPDAQRPIVIPKAREPASDAGKVTPPRRAEAREPARRAPAKSGEAKVSGRRVRQ